MCLEVLVGDFSAFCYQLSAKLMFFDFRMNKHMKHFASRVTSADLQCRPACFK